MNRPLFDRLAAAIGIGADPLSRRGALGRLGRVGVASALGAAAAAPAARAQTTEPTEDSDAAEAPAGSEEVVVPPATRETLGPSQESPAGALRRLTDYDRSLWLNSGFGWSGISGHVFDVRAFGAVGDGATDDWAAFAEAIEAMSSPLDDDATTAFGRTLLVPPGRYRLSQSLVLTRAVTLLGAVGSGRVGDAVLVPDPGIVGLVVEASDSPLRGIGGRRGEGATIASLRIEAGALREGDAQTGSGAEPGSVSMAARSAIPGVLLRARATLKDCVVAGFSGDGILVEAAAETDAAAADAFEADGWTVEGCRVEACGGNGLAARGGSAGLCAQVLAVGNGGWGILEDSFRGNTYLQCRAAGNGEGAFTSGGGANRSLFLGCESDPGQARSVFAEETLVVGGDHAAGYLGGNAWVADESRLLLRAQAPVGGATVTPTAPTLHLLAAAGQTQPHLRVADRAGDRLAEVDAAGRLVIGPADLVAPGTRAEAPDAFGLRPVQIQISHQESGRSALRWAVGGEAATWVAQARAFHDPAPLTEEAGEGDPATRLVFQTPTPTGQEIDTLTLRQGRVGVGTTAPDPAAVLDLSSASRGFLPPRLTVEQRDAIVAPPEGLTIYNRTTRRLNFHDGEAWREVTAG